MSFLEDAIALSSMTDAREIIQQAIRELLVKYKGLGYAQEDVYYLLAAILEIVQAHNDIVREDIVLDAMAATDGDGRQDYWIWPEHMSDRLAALNRSYDQTG